MSSTVVRSGSQANAEDSAPLLQQYFPSLDGLRAVAIGLVLTFHMGGAYWRFRYSPAGWGWIGVDLFFVLSGFLITGILYDSLHRADYFRNFYIRRSLRIFPLYYGVLTLVVLASFAPHIHVFWNRYDLAWPLYLGNLYSAGGALGHHARLDVLNYRIGQGPIHLLGLSHLWSLCVEEQFYLFWPGIIFLLRSRKRLLTLCAVVIIAGPLLRTWFINRHMWMVSAADPLYSNTLSRCDTLLIGAALALLLRGPIPNRAVLRRVAWALLLGPSSIFAWLCYRAPPPHLPPSIRLETVTWGFTLIALAFSGLLLLTLDPSTPFARVLRLRPFVFLGRISYGVYIFQGFLWTMLPRLEPTFVFLHCRWAVPFFGSALTVALAWLSFRFFESPFLRLKPLLAPRPGAADDPPPSGDTQHLEPAVPS